MVIKLHRKGKTAEEISDIFDIALTEVLHIINTLQQG